MLTLTEVSVSQLVETSVVAYRKIIQNFKQIKHFDLFLCVKLSFRCVCANFYAFYEYVIMKKEPCDRFRKALLVVYDRVVRISPG